MSWKECWSRPIDVLDGKERHALRKNSALKSSPCAQLPDSPTCASRNARMLRNSCSNAQVSSQPPFALPFLSVVLCHTLRVCLENTLTVPGDQLPIGECVFFLHTISEQDLHLLSVHGSAHLGSACLLRSRRFWRACTDIRRALSDSDLPIPQPSRFRRDKTSELSSTTHLRSSEGRP